MNLDPVLRRLGTALALAIGAAAAEAHGDAVHADGPVRHEQKPWGIAGEAKAVRRSVSVAMRDTMRFTPSHIDVREGDTLRFVVRNRGKLQHEFVIGTPAELEAHAALMAKFPGMEHDEPYMVHVAPGGRGEIVWQFNRAGAFEFACLIGGHFSAGMKGSIRVAATPHTSQPR